MIVGAVIGHSFVSGLADHLSHGGPRVTSTDVANALQISDKCRRLALLGNRGTKVLDPTFSLPSEALQHYKPDFCILQLGSNDLAAGCPASTVADQVHALAECLVRDYGVTIVIIAGAVPRIGHLRLPQNTDFDEVMQAYNTALYQKCSMDSQIHYKSHSGFWQNPIHHWSWDGIHPNTTMGRRLFKKSIRQLAFFGSSQVQKIHNKFSKYKCYHHLPHWWDSLP